MNLFISADIEGVAGFSHPQDGMPGGPFYPEARGWMTGEVIAACEAARAAGVEGITVADGHGLGRNLVLDKLPDWVEVVNSWPRPLLWAQGAEAGRFDGALLIGHHQGAGMGGLLAHTIHGGRFSAIRINGEPASETRMLAAALGEMEVPVALVSGDQAYCEHAQALLPWISTVVLKHASGYQSARSVTPARGRQMIAEAVTQLVPRLDQMQCYREPGPLQFEAAMVRSVEAELYGYLPGFERRQGNVVAFEAESMVAALRILMFMATMTSEI